MNNLSFYIFLILVIVIFESFAQYHIKKSKVQHNMLYLIIAVAAYGVVCLLLHKCYDFMGMGITNFVWSVLSIVSILSIGIILFDEHITKYDVIGIVLSITGLYLIFVKDHPLPTRSS